MKFPLAFILVMVTVIGCTSTPTSQVKTSVVPATHTPYPEATVMPTPVPPITDQIKPTVAASEDPESIGAAVVFTRQLDKQALGRAVQEVQAKSPQDLEAANGVLQQEGLGAVIWVIVGAVGSTGGAILMILFVVLNRNRKKAKRNSRLADDINGDRRIEEN